MTDVLSPASVGFHRQQAGQGDLPTGFGLFVAAWVSLGLWAGLIGIVLRLAALIA